MRDKPLRCPLRTLALYRQLSKIGELTPCSNLAAQANHLQPSARQAFAEVCQIRFICIVHGREKLLQVKLGIKLPNARHMGCCSRSVAKQTVRRRDEGVLLRIQSR